MLLQVNSITNINNDVYKSLFIIININTPEELFVLFNQLEKLAKLETIYNKIVKDKNYYKSYIINSTSYNGNYEECIGIIQNNITKHLISISNIEEDCNKDQINTAKELISKFKVNDITNIKSVNIFDSEYVTISPSVINTMD